MLRLTLPLMLFSAACAPPPAVDVVGSGVPTVALLYPPRNPTLCLDDDGAFEVLVVVQVSDFVFVDFGSAEGNVEGEGHMHVRLNSTDYDPTSDTAYVLTRDPGEYVEGDNVILEVTLQQSLHDDVPDADNDLIEFVVQAAGTKGCDNQL